jgi:glycosyltransferase involved in cell wall biosynthesis
MKVLLVQGSDISAEARQRRLDAEKSDRGPHWSAFEAGLATSSIDLSILQTAPAWRKVLYRFLPRHLCLALEALRRRRDFDVVVTWSEQVTIFFALLQRLSWRRTPHVALLYWMSKGNIRFLLQLAHPAMTRIVTWVSEQARYATAELGIPAGKIELVKYPTDPRFWRPLGTPEAADLICSAGAENRDFPTLIEAMRGLPLTCRIAARDVRVIQGGRARKVDPQAWRATLPENVDIRPHSPTELRDLYATARFVVVPLLPTDTDNGITVILEAMSMGKAVICTRTRGQVDVIENGVNGIFVEGGDPAALRAAIVDLWQNPDKAAAIGRNARAYVEASRHPLERFTAAVANVAAEAAQMRKGGI